jgi:RimJ/RimL family protein N-acetyltransferase
MDTDTDRAFRIRSGRVADLPGVLDLLEAVAAEGRWIGAESIDREQRRAALVESIADPAAAVFVADAAGAVIGQLGMALRPYGVAEIGMLVAASWRGRGVGSALLGAGIDWAGAAGAHKVALQVWTHNDAARALYRRFGFVEEGVLRRHYRRRNGERWDAIIMGLFLDGPAPEPG